MSYQVRDEAGNLWPPGFRSQLTDPKSQFTVLTGNALTSARATEARAQAAAEGKGWANGTIESLAGDRFRPGPVPEMRKRAFRFRPGSTGEAAYKFLQERGPLKQAELAKLLRIQKCDVRAYVRKAITAGVIAAKRVDASTVVYSASQAKEVSA